MQRLALHPGLYLSYAFILASQRSTTGAASEHHAATSHRCVVGGPRSEGESGRTSTSSAPKVAHQLARLRRLVLPPGDRIGSGREGLPELVRREERGGRRGAAGLDAVRDKRGLAVRVGRANGPLGTRRRAEIADHPDATDAR